MKLLVLFALVGLSAVAQAGPPPLLLKIASPQHAGRVRGPEVTVTWEQAGAASLRISLDGRRAVMLPPTRKEYEFSGLAQGVHTVRMASTAPGRTASAESTFYVDVPPQLPASKLYVLDLTALQKTDPSDSVAAAKAFDTLHVASVLQGLVNRRSPQLYLIFTNVDRFWLDKMRERGAYLEHTLLTPVASVDEAISSLGRDVKGAVVWDPELPCTSHVASTICGVENLLPVRYDDTPGSMYDRLVKSGLKLEVRHNLVGQFAKGHGVIGLNPSSMGSPKVDAYTWATRRYLETGKCKAGLIGYWCDSFWLKHPTNMSLENVGLTNQDYIIANKGFLCDIDVWADEIPRDDPGQRQGLDREVFESILRASWKMNKGGMTHVCGFTPWSMKYTSYGNAGGKHEPVPTEWETARLLSSYNAYLDADAIGYTGMANASVFMHCPLPDRLIQNPPPTREQLEARGYILPDGKVAPLNFVYHYLGDYDSAAWLYHAAPGIWRHERRGKAPSGWAFNPNLIDRLPVAFDWFYRTKSPMDYFIAGDSGAGYVNPTQLLEPRKPSGLPSGSSAWAEHCARYYGKLDYSLTGFILNGSSGLVTDDCAAIYRPFSADGIMTQTFWLPGEKKRNYLLDGMVVAEMKRDIGGTAEQAADQVAAYGKPGETAFLSFRSILVGPEYIQSINDLIKAKRPECRFEPVDPYTYFYLLRHHLGGRNEMRATYTFDTMPRSLRAGQKVRVAVGVRNDGWEVWHASGPDRVALSASLPGAREVRARLPRDVGPGEGAVISFTIASGKTQGRGVFLVDLVKGRDSYFRYAGNPPWRSEVSIQ